MSIRRRIRNCHCGACCVCLENARWERIFQEKFADPYYYGPAQVRHTSSLDYRAPVRRASSDETEELKASS